MGPFCTIDSIIAKMPRKGARKRLTRRKRRIERPMPASRPSAKRKQWTNEQMVAAMKAVEDGGPVRGAARDHGVPYSTLKDRVSGRVEHGTKPGPKPYLNTEEEDELGQFLKNCATVGFGRTRRDAMHIAEAVVREKGNLKKEKLHMDGGIAFFNDKETYHSEGVTAQQMYAWMQSTRKPSTTISPYLKRS